MDPVLCHVRVQAVKAARREEDVAVCVVQLVPSDHAPESDSQYLLVQRPEKGLLAGIHALVLLSCACLPLQSNACNTMTTSSNYALHFHTCVSQHSVMHAGLWEFPGWQVDSAAASNRASLGQAVDDKLPELIGVSSMSALGSLQLVRRFHLGSVGHTFSHIQQTMHIELLVLQVYSLALW